MLTFIIPTAPYHEAAVNQAVASCLAQTLRCEVVVVYDGERRGAGWARNRGLEQVQTPFVAFLDADDTVAPEFAEKMLRAYDGQHYVFSDWYQEDATSQEHIPAPVVPWRFQPQGGPESHHIVTALVPTSWARRFGFDESLPGGEDAEFYIHLTREGMCGRRVAEPLVAYRKGGQRGRAFVFGESGVFGAGPHFRRVISLLTERYGAKAMACCGENAESPDTPFGDKQPDDVQARTLWMGNRRVRGSATGRLYARTGNGALLWVDPRDIDDAPDKFARLVEAPPMPDEDDFQQLAAFAQRSMTPRMAPRAADVPLVIPAVEADIQPDVSRVLRLYNPELELTSAQVNTIRAGGTVEVNAEGVTAKPAPKKKSAGKATRKDDQPANAQAKQA